MKLEPEPESVKVASVWVDQVPSESRPPTLEPDRRALIVARAGRAPEVCEICVNMAKHDSFKEIYAGGCGLSSGNQQSASHQVCKDDSETYRSGLNGAELCVIKLRKREHAR